MSCDILRKVVRKFSLDSHEGCGVLLDEACEVTFELKYFDPFLVLDEFSLCAPAGFPDHPHRGFETVTYMLQGAVTHEDFEGRKGTIGVGDLQWMTAGRGICIEGHGTKSLMFKYMRATEDGVRLEFIAISPCTKRPTAYNQLPESLENAFVYVLEGEGVFGKSKSSPTSAHNLLLLGPGIGLDALE
ncbi:pirin-like protein [Tanacetum coccineum]